MALRWLEHLGFAPRLERREFLDDADLRGGMCDGDLSVVAPSVEQVEAFLASAADERSRTCPHNAIDRAWIDDLLRRAPGGRQRPPRGVGCDLAYRYWLKLDPPEPLPFAGTVTLRIGDDHELEQYVGHIGYLIFPPCRGRSLAGRAVTLLLPLAARHGMRSVIITINPDNRPSQRVIEKLGGTLLGEVDLPEHHPLRERGESRKLRYRLPTGLGS